MALDCWFPSPQYPPRARSSQIPFLKDNNARDYDAFYSKRYESGPRMWPCQ